MIETTLTVSPSDPGLDLTLTVANGGDRAVDLEFRSGRRADFAAYDAGTDEAVWRWSEGRMFTQALESTTLAPGESTSIEAQWEDPPSGTYRVVGELAARDRDATAEVTVEL